MAVARLPSVEIDGLTVAYARAGEGPPIVILHGILSDSRAWRRQLEGLSGDFTVIAWDAPGAGQSSDPPGTFGFRDYAHCLAALLDALELEQAHVLGLSWGGVLAQEVYRAHPARVRSLILADTYAGWVGSLPEEVWKSRLEECLRESEMPAGEFAEKWMPGLVSAGAPPEVAEEVAALIHDFHPEGYRQMALALAGVDTRDLLPRMRAPTLLLWGEHDARSPLHIAEQLRDGIPGAKLVVIPDAGHESNLEQPERFNAAVAEFCRDVESALARQA